jgi:hypothetical protein
VTYTTTFGRTQCTRDSFSGEPKRLSRGGGLASGMLATCSGASTPAKRFSSLSVPAQPAAAYLARRARDPTSPVSKE